MSTYLVALVARPYAHWHDEYVDDHTDGTGATIPLGLYCRASLARYMDRLFAETKRGFGFFQHNFSPVVQPRTTRSGAKMSSSGRCTS
jgi:aminopeptidase N